MKRLAAFLILANLCVSSAVPVLAHAGNSAKSQERASRKTARKQQKALNKYMKAQRKAQRKMEKNDRKNTHYPKRSF